MKYTEYYTLFLRYQLIRKLYKTDSISEILWDEIYDKFYRGNTLSNKILPIKRNTQSWTKLIFIVH